jgi:arabinose-5-phosphate isomerase
LSWRPEPIRKDAAQNVVSLRERREARNPGLLDEAREVFRDQARAIAELAERVDERFAQAVELLYATEGRVVVLGVGKSGLIGQKIASTLASTGTPAFFVNAAEAHHGDLGMVTPHDTAVLISRSGETSEVVSLLGHLERLGVPVVALIGEQDSTLGRRSTVALDASVEREVCPNNLAPTNSTLAALAMGDALAVALIRRRRFQPEDFAMVHPGGSLGQRLTGARVRDAMRSKDLPIVKPSATVGESLVVMTRGQLGLVLVTSGDRLLGLITDGDLRRAMLQYENLQSLPVTEIMTLNPATISEDKPLAEAHARMRTMKLKALVVVSGNSKVSGVVEIFDES